MRIAATFFASWLLTTALTNGIPAAQDGSSIFPISERQDDSTESYRGKQLQADAYASIARLGQQTYQATHQPSQWKKCSVSNIIIRREWYKPHGSPFQILIDNIRSAFSTAEKKHYISAVRCMAKLSSKTPKSVCPGCRNRYDDFVATHIQQTFTVCLPSIHIDKAFP